MEVLINKGKLSIAHGVGKEIKMKDIIIKIKENEDRKVIFKMPSGDLDINLSLNTLKQGTFNIFWELKDLKKAIKDVSNKDIASRWQPKKRVKK
jgi:hypothetical protein